MSPRSWKYEQKRPFAEKYFLEQFRQARLASTLYMALGNILFILNLPAFVTNKRIHGVYRFRRNGPIYVHTCMYMAKYDIRYGKIPTKKAAVRALDHLAL